MRVSAGFEKTAFIGALLRGAGKVVATPAKFLGKKLLGLGTTEGKLNVALTGGSALSDYGRYAEKFQQAER